MPYRYAKMASVHRQNSKPNFFCAFYDPEGYRRFRSTGSEKRQIATTICNCMQRGSILAKQGRLSSEKALKLIRETQMAIEERHGKLAADQAHNVLKQSFEDFIRIGGGDLTSFTVRSWLNSWLDGRTDASKATIVEYRRVIDLFLRFLGARGDRAITTLQPKQVEDFKHHLASRVSPSTVNKAIKVLKASFNNAVAKRQLEFSPAEHVQPIDREERSRRPFTADELTSLLKAAEPEWRTMVLVAFYTGLRLTDCANLSWRNIQLHTKTINVVTKKTGRQQDLPIADTLARHLHTIAGDNPDAPLCPGLTGKRASWLSAQFYKVMEDAGIVESRDHQTKNKGRDSRRDLSQISFHSLRHNTTSALKSAGVNDSIAMDIVGHDTAAVSRSYTKIDDSAKRVAIAKLPDITAVATKQLQ